MTYIYNTSLQEESSAGHPIARVLQSRVAVSTLTGLVIAQLKLQCIYYWAQCWPLLPRYELWMYYERPSEQPCIFLLKFDLTTVHRVVYLRLCAARWSLLLSPPSTAQTVVPSLSDAVYCSTLMFEMNGIIGWVSSLLVVI